MEGGDNFNIGTSNTQQHVKKADYAQERQKGLGI
mgnify:CR=1 FL=1